MSPAATTTDEPPTPDGPSPDWRPPAVVGPQHVGPPADGPEAPTTERRRRRLAPSLLVVTLLMIVAGTAGSATSRRPAASRAGPPAAHPPTRSARRIAATVSSSAGAIIVLELGAGEPHRGCARRAAPPGSRSRCRTTAPPWPRRSRGAAGPGRSHVAGSVGVEVREPSPSASRTCRKTASSKSMPPRCSMPSGSPSSSKPSASCAARPRRRCRRPGRRPRPVAGGHPVAARRSAIAAASGSVRSCRTPAGRRAGSPGEQVPLVRAPVGRVGDADVVRRAALPLGGDCDHRGAAAAPSAPAPSTARRRRMSGTGSPIRRLNSRASRAGSAAPGARRPRRPAPRRRGARTPRTASRPGCPAATHLDARPPTHTAAAVWVVPRSTPSP